MIKLGTPEIFLLLPAGFPRSENSRMSQTLRGVFQATLLDNPEAYIVFYPEGILDA